MRRWWGSTACDRTRQLISLELDGELTELEAAALQRHRASCADCRAIGVEFAAFTHLLRDAPQVELPAKLDVSAPRRARARTARRAAISLAFAGLIAAASFGGFALRGSGGSTSSALAFRNHQEQRRFARVEAERIEPTSFAVVTPTVRSYAARALV